MSLKRLGVMALGFILVVALSATLCADVPDSNTGPGWYAGTWKVTFVEKCRDHEGKKVNIKKKTFYWDMTADSLGFSGDLFPDKALTPMTEVGTMGVAFTFRDFPDPGEEMFLCYGGGGFDVGVLFRGLECGGQFWGYLKTGQDKWDPSMTEKKVTKLRKKSKLRGWYAFCCDDDADTLVCCDATWAAKWIDGPDFPP